MNSKDAGKSSLIKNILIVLFISAVSFSPRMSMSILSGGRSLDLRIEDLLLIFIIVLWFFNIIVRKQAVYFPPILKSVMIYLFVAFISTSIGIFNGWINPVRAVFFCLKEIEYFLILFMAYNFIDNDEYLETAVYSTFICAIVNGFYVFFQIYTGRMANYYTGTIGEPGKFISGGYFAVLLTFSAVAFLMSAKPKLKYISSVSLAICMLGLISSASRANILGAIFSFLFLIFFLIAGLKNRSNIIFMRPKYIIALVLAFLMLSGAFLRIKTLKYITSREAARESFLTARVDTIYVPLLKQFKKNPVLGSGKTACSITVPGSGEAHNYYLRILVEMGIIGLVSFLYILFSILKMALSVFNNAGLPVFKRAIGLSCLLVTLSMMVAAFAQDAFLPVKVNEMFWLFVGLAASMCRAKPENTLKQISGG